MQGQDRFQAGTDHRLIGIPVPIDPTTRFVNLCAVNSVRQRRVSATGAMTETTATGGHDQPIGRDVAGLVTTSHRVSAADGDHRATVGGGPRRRKSAKLHADEAHDQADLLPHETRFKVAVSMGRALAVPWLADGGRRVNGSAMGVACGGLG